MWILRRISAINTCRWTVSFYEMVSFLHVLPQLRKNDRGIEAVRKIAVMLPVVSDKEVALITNEWKVYQSGDEIVDTI